MDDSGPPAEGDVRLVPLNGNSPPTAACDEVHFGGVELFHDGRWGRICMNREPYELTLDAEVVCRQLGFLAGGVFDTDESYPFSFTSDYADDYSFFEDREEQPVWATQVCQPEQSPRQDRWLLCMLVFGPYNRVVTLQQFSFAVTACDPAWYSATPGHCVVADSHTRPSLHLSVCLTQCK